LIAIAHRAVGGLPRAFWWLWVATLINRLGGFVPAFLMLYLTLDRGYSVAYAGLVVAFSGAGGALATLVGGVLADRVGRRPTLLLSQLATALSTAVLGFTDGQVAIAVVACLVGFASAASRPVVAAMTADLVPAADRSRAFSLNYWAVNIGFSVSASVAGVLAVHGYLWLFVGEAAMTLVCAFVIFVKVAESRPVAAAGEVAPKAGGLVGVLRDRRFMALIGLTFLLALVQLQSHTTLAVSVARSGLSTTDYGLVMALNGVLVVVLQIPLTKVLDGRDRGWVLGAAGLLLGWGFALSAFADSVAFYAFTVVVWTIGEIIYAPLVTAVAVELSPPAARGRYQGVFAFTFAGAAFAGPALGGLVMDRAGELILWMSCGVVGTVVAVGYFIVARRAASVPVIN
jgi:MFS family permease